MHLITKTTLYFLTSTLLLFAAGGVVFYFQMKQALDEELTENLYSAKDNLRKSLKDQDSIPTTMLLAGEYISFLQSKTVKDVIRDTLIFDETEQENVVYRMLSFSAGKPGKEFTVSVGLPVFESDDLVETIVFSFVLISLVLVLLLFLLSRIISKRLWKPFFKTLDQLNRYRHPSNDKLVFSQTNTKEFQTLNHAVEDLTQRVTDSYEKLKAFTANASHELQTPLASILLEAEKLMQAPDLSESSADSLTSIHKTVKRTERLVESLLLLAKVGNGQYVKQRINFSETVNRKINDFLDRIEFSGLDFQKKIAEEVVLETSSELAEILVSNLLSNAVRHNIAYGKIHVELTSDLLRISNTGDPLPFEADKLFSPFVHDLRRKDSLGLGLSLVKEIAAQNGWKILHNYSGSLHAFTLVFESEK